jgi:hypothetical protein
MTVVLAIRGETDSGGHLKVGDRVTVVEDPGRLVAARLPQDVRPVRDAFEFSALTVALAGGFAWAVVCDECARRTELGGGGATASLVGPKTPGASAPVAPPGKVGIRCKVSAEWAHSHPNRWAVRVPVARLS